MRAVWQIIRAQYRHDKSFFLLGVLVSMIPAAAGLLLLGVSGWFITAAAVAGLSGSFLNIFAPSAIIRALAIARTGGRYGERVLTHDATFRFLSDLRNRIFSTMSANGQRGARSGKLLNRLTLDIAALDTLYLRLVVPGVVAAVLALSLAVWWSTITLPVLAVGSLFICAWLGVFAFSLSRADRKTARRADAALEAMRLRTTDLVAGRRDLAIYGGLDAAARTVLAAEERLQAAETLEDRRALKLGAASGLIGQLFLAASLAVVVWSALAGHFSAAFAVALVLVAMALPETIGLLVTGLNRLPRIALAAGRSRQLMPEDGPAGPKPMVSDVKSSAGPPAVALSFQDVGFRYPGAARDVLNHFGFQLANGEVLAITGRSGCGKSTVAALAARLIVPGRGRILLNGQDLETFPDANLRSRVSVLGQRPYLFNDTVAANLRIARPDADANWLWEALEKASLADRIRSAPLGLDTVMGEGGLGLSGGEQRRLALARAFLTRPDLFILDEMTEGLDAETAAAVLERFFAFRGEASVLMITHKQREAAHADRCLHLTENPSI
ncbi:thiol reductant ABC exporter subunit CydC [Roseibium sediminicola]|uniref:Thiol reductant ABC exporter subunit CydC n=1 Tax=Roseibium sediminicola TaxID=2933272 RepID=A0ABT0H0D1_9HYPH|nr:thiol reductant ABC exporter subunit CydC [Roseibium sp. CAU 1639]MCK7614742.1 thiol reductant ABC exporter subunit CydC [Roseibium sp. CAU 1639]